MSAVYVFAGPTITADAVRAEMAGGSLPPSAEVRVCGPASFGDVCRTTEARPIALAIIDGYFERVPAVWHKEILWAMSEGVHVFGASSMGALRAAELSAFGMVGVGSIFEAYRSGALEDDDEVAVVHGPAEDGYPALSEAMVNVRATLEAAEKASVIREATASALVGLLKSRFYGDRSYPAMFVEAEARGVDGRELEALRAWLPRGRVDRKREDAVRMLRQLRDWLATSPPRRRVSYRFESTDAWLEARRVALAGAGGPDLGPARMTEGLLEELRVAGAYAGALQGASARASALEEAKRAGIRPDTLAVRTAIEEFRRERALLDRMAFERWRSDQRLDEEGLRAFFEDQARLHWARPITQMVARDHLVDHLRATGEFGRIATRAEAKAKRLEEQGDASPSLQGLGVTEQDLWRWYFEERLGTKVPENLEAFATGAGFAGQGEMRSALLRELSYVRHGLR